MKFFSESHFTRTDAFVLAAVMCLVLAPFVTSRLIGWVILELSLLILGFLILAFLVAYRRRSLYELAKLQRSVVHLNRRTKQLFKQTEYLVSINASLAHGGIPFPTTGGWVPAPDYLHFLMSHLHHRKPDLVLEAGSGVSTYLTAKTLEHIGKGQVIALEHQAAFAAKTRRLIEAAGLQHRARVLYAPLREYQLSGDTHRWYDLTDLQLPGPIGLFVVDGPPGNTGKHARYPALPLLREQMADDAVILLDDATRLEEREIVDMWSNDFGVEAEYLDLKKGAFYIELASVLRRKELME